MSTYQIEYKTLEVMPFSGSTEWVRYRKYDKAGEQTLDIATRYAILLVLEGSLHLTFNIYTVRDIASKSLIVIDREQLSRTSCLAGTALLVFMPPEKMFRYFGNCSSAFQVPCSTIVPILPTLQKWADDLMIELSKPQEELTDECRRNYCVRLRDILNAYPPLLVGELLVAFHACSISGENKCGSELHKHSKNHKKCNIQ